MLDNNIWNQIIVRKQNIAFKLNKNIWIEMKLLMFNINNLFVLDSNT